MNNTLKKYLFWIAKKRIMRNNRSCNKHSDFLIETIDGNCYNTIWLTESPWKFYLGKTIFSENLVK